MFNKFKEAIVKTTEEEPKNNGRRPNMDLSFISAKEIEEYKKIAGEVAESIHDVGQLARNNKTAIIAFIKEQKDNLEKNHQPEGDDEQYTFEEDLIEIKTIIGDVIVQVSKLQQSHEEIKDKVRSAGQGESPDKVKELLEIIKKYESDLKLKDKSDQNNREILTTLKQQTQLLSKQTKDLQEKCIKLERDLNEKTLLVINIQEQKNVLLQMQNNQDTSVNPELQLVRKQLHEANTKLAIERTKLTQKEKEIDTLRKKMEEDRDSLEKIADELKEKELKSKKILDKYERSKTEIRKYREEKTQFIKKLNLEIINLTDKSSKLETENVSMKETIREAAQKNEYLDAQVSKNEGKNADLQSAKEQIKMIRQEQIEMTGKLQEKDQEASQLKNQVDQLQSKRKSLLEALEKPINHEIRTLDKIIKALQKLYKEYIDVVFTQGNIIGFENRISYILSNVCDIKEDLKL